MSKELAPEDRQFFGSSPSRSPREFNWSLLNTMTGPFLLGYSLASFLFAVPAIANGLATDMAGIAWAVVALPLAIASVCMPMGQMGAIYGHRRVYRIGLGLMTMCALLCGLSRTVMQLAVFKFCEGIGAAMMHSNSRLLAAEAMPESTARGQALITMSAHAGGFSGCILSGILIDRFNWQAMFITMFFIGSAFLLMSRLSPSDGNTDHAVVPASAQPVDILGSGLMFASGVLATILLTIRIANRFSPEQRCHGVAVLAVLLVAFLIWESLAKNPLVKLSLLRNRPLGYSVASLGLLSLPYGLLALFIPFYFKNIQRIDFSYIGLAFAVQPLFIVPFSRISGLWADRSGPAAPASLGTLFLFIGMSIGVLLRTDSSLLSPVAIMICLGIALGLFQPALFASVFASLSREDRWRANGFIPTVNQVCTVVGTALATDLLLMDFKHFLGDHLLADPHGGFLEAYLYSGIRARIFTDTFVLSMNAACLLGIACCVVAWIMIFLLARNQRSFPCQ